MKIALYAIAKNESKFVERFCNSAKDADLILIADTGSTDDTIEKAKACGAEVHQIYISPWRFDTARNVAMALLPRDVDVCVPIDLDEVLEPGWREEIEKCWVPGTTRMSYIYDWGQNWRMASDRMHARQGYRWKHGCHECMAEDPRIKTSLVKTDKLLVRHLPDQEKNRGQYLELLEAGSKEEPESPRDSFYYGRELMFHGKNEDAINEMKRYLSLNSARWRDERAMVMRFIGKCLKNVGKIDEAIEWFIRGTQECPERRETWFFLAEAYYNIKDWEKCYETSTKCLEVPYKESWPNQPEAGGFLPYDYAAISAYYSGRKKEAIAYGKKALELNPTDERLKGNMKFYRES
jgi:glycosyltransferase involved in cell wall biosynthesis